MAIFSRLLFLFCGTLFLISPASQTRRSYEIHSLNGIQTVLSDVVKIENIDKLQSSNFPQDFEIEMRNISKKPIYFMHMMVIFRGTSRLTGGAPIGFKVSFGRWKLVNINNRPQSTDTPAKPGETFVLKPNVNNVKGVRTFLENKVGSSNVEAALSNIALVFQVINFGDGTGYRGGEPESDKVSQNVFGNNKEYLMKAFLGSTKSTHRTKAPSCDTWKEKEEEPECNAGCEVTQTDLTGGQRVYLCFVCALCGTGCCNQDYLVNCESACPFS